MQLVVGSRYIELSSRAVVVDDTSLTSRAYNLDHHIGNRTPPKFMDEVATGVVLRALDSGLDLRSFRWACIRHYDTDGCLAVWALLNPEAACDSREILIAAAKCGDFYEVSTDPNGMRALAISSYIQEHLPRIRGVRASNRELIKQALADVDVMLNNPGHLRTGWQSAVRQFEEDSEELRLRQILMRSKHAIVIEAPRDFCLAALVSSAPEPIIIVASSGTGNTWSYTVTLRPRHSWAYAEEAVGHIPVRDLRPARDWLMDLERMTTSRAFWTSDTFDRSSSWRLWTLRAPSHVQPDALISVIERLFAPKSLNIS